MDVLTSQLQKLVAEYAFNPGSLSWNELAHIRRDSLNKQKMLEQSLIQDSLFQAQNLDNLVDFIWSTYIIGRCRDRPRACPCVRRAEGVIDMVLMQTSNFDMFIPWYRKVKSFVRRPGHKSRKLCHVLSLMRLRRRSTAKRGNSKLSKSVRVKTFVNLASSEFFSAVLMLNRIQNPFGIPSGNPTGELRDSTVHMSPQSVLHCLYQTWNLSRFIGEIIDIAAKKGYVNVLKFLHGVGLTAEHIRADNNNAFCQAAERGRVDVLRFFYSIGLDANDARSNSNYALERAARNGHETVLDFLLEIGLHLGDASRGAVREAAANGHVNVLKCFYYKWGMTSGDGRNHHALIEAASAGHASVLSFMHRAWRLDRYDFRYCENCALVFAAKNGHVNVLEFLHRVIALTAKDARSHNNEALREAAKNGHAAVLEFLHSRWGLNADDARSDNNAALRYAAKNGHVNVLQVLHRGWGLNAGDARCNDNEALCEAAENGHVNVLDFMYREWGLTREDARSRLYSAYFHAEENGHVDVLEFLERTWKIGNPCLY